MPTNWGFTQVINKKAFILVAFSDYKRSKALFTYITEILILEKMCNIIYKKS